MKLKDFKQTAKESLKGNWLTAIIAGLVATSFGASGTSINFSMGSLFPGIDNNSGEEGVTALVNAVSQQGGEGELSYLLILYGMGFAYLTISFLVSVLISSFVRVGYAQFNLDLIDNSGSKFVTLFSRIGQFGVAFRTYVLMYLRVCLGALLIIPGILMSYSYAMFEYVLADNPDMNAREVLAESRRIMRGNRFKLFCLQLSFIGPALLCVLTFGIGLLWFIPYYNATMAAFYREIN